MKDICGAVKSQVAIIDLVKDFGFTLVRKGRYYSLKEHDSVMIDPEKNCYWRNSNPGNGVYLGKGGSVIDFAMEFASYSLEEALWNLGKRINFSACSMNGCTSQKIVIPKPKTFRLPPKGKNMHRVFAYLIKTRMIRAEVVQDLVKRKQLYQDSHGNCVFVSYGKDHQAEFACRRGTNTRIPFYGDVAGSDYTKGFYLDYGADKIYVTESVIDALSVMTLKKEDARQWNYLSLCSVGKWMAVCSYLDQSSIRGIWIGLDNDDPGIDAGKKLAGKVNEFRPDMQIYFDFPPEREGKDWNEVLIKRRGCVK